MRIGERAIDVGLSCEVHDGIAFHGQRHDVLPLADIAMHEMKATLVFEVCQVGAIARVRELVEHRDFDVRTSLAQQMDKVRADETRASPDEELLVRPHLIAGPAVQSYPMAGSSCGIRPSSSGA